jgi:regulatory protein
MSSTGGERIAPVTYLFRSRAEEAAPTEAGGEEGSGAHGEHDQGGTPPVLTTATSPATSGRAPMFVDLGDQGSADEKSAAVRAELEREARTHIERDTAEAAAPARKASFAPINNVSMHALARRGMSSREMRDYLIGRDFEPGAVDDEVERLESVALLDDVALGETLVRTLRDRKGLGRSALTAELRRRHLDATAIEIALEGLDDDELERATEIAHKRAGQLRSYDTETAKRRLGAFLMRKGYSGSVVSTAVQRALAPSGSGSASSGPVFR